MLTQDPHGSPESGMVTDVTDITHFPMMSPMSAPAMILEFG